MRKSGLNVAAFAAAFLLAFVSSSGALALDATSFDPRNVSVEADSISGVPVGTIITWPVATNPEGWDEGNWLECNGQSVNPTVYPELFALVGATVPDLRNKAVGFTGKNPGEVTQKGWLRLIWGGSGAGSSSPDIPYGYVFTLKPPFGGAFREPTHLGNGVYSFYKPGTGSEPEDQRALWIPVGGAGEAVEVRYLIRAL